MYMVSNSSIGAAQAEIFECPTCGAPHLHFNPETEGLRCAQCGFSKAIPAIHARVEEHDLDEDFIQSNKAKGYGRVLSGVVCNSCGAKTRYDPSIVSMECPFCGSAQVLEPNPNPNVIQPEAVIPFKLTKDEAYEQYKRWLADGWFRPNDVLKSVGTAQIQGVYLPFWTFDAHAESDWEAESGDHYYETEYYDAYENGKRIRASRRVQKTRWYHSSGHHSESYDDVLIPASTSGDQEMLQNIYPFETNKLLPYQSEFLSGWAAEAYTVPLAIGWKRGIEAMNAFEVSNCAQLVPGDTYRNLRVTTTLSNPTYKHVLLPVFLAHYRYNNELYHFMVNGQTGEVQGDAPVSWIKVMLAIIPVLIILGLGFYLYLAWKSQ